MVSEGERLDEGNIAVVRSVERADSEERAGRQSNILVDESGLFRTERANGRWPNSIAPA